MARHDISLSSAFVSRMNIVVIELLADQLDNLLGLAEWTEQKSRGLAPEIKKTSDLMLKK